MRMDRWAGTCKALKAKHGVCSQPGGAGEPLTVLRRTGCDGVAGYATQFSC